MHIRMTHRMSSSYNGEPWPAPGEVIELPDDEALVVLRNRMAVPVETAAAKRKATARRSA